MEDTITILPFSDDLAVYFSIFNKAWLEKYFEVEPIDEKMLANPKQYFIDTGGLIFFAAFNNEIVGTFALKKMSSTVFELAKMAVEERFQGKRIGNVMMQFCLQEAKRLGVEQLCLYSNTRLLSAIHLYRKYGFVAVPDFKSDYQRADIKMEITL